MAMTSKVQIAPSSPRQTGAANRRQTIPIQQKRRKPRRQSGAAVATENKETIVHKARLERTDSDKVIRRNSMERKMSVRNSIRLPEDFLKGLKGLDDSVTRMSLSQSIRGISARNLLHGGGATGGGSTEGDHSSRRGSDSEHGPVFTEQEIAKMSQEALEFSDSDAEEASLGLDEPIIMIAEEEEEEHP